MVAQTDSNLMERLKRAVYPSDPSKPDGDWNIRTAGASGGTSTTDNSVFTPGASSITPAGGYYGGRQIASGNIAAPAVNGSAILQVDVISTVGGGGGVSAMDDSSFLAGTANLTPVGAYYGGRQVGSGHIGAPAMSGSAILKSDANIYRQVTVATMGIGSGNTSSSLFDFRPGAMLGLIVPAFFTGTYLNFNISPDGSNFYKLYDNTGVVVQMTVNGSGGGYDLPTPLASWPYFQAVSSTAEASPRTLTVVAKG